MASISSRPAPGVIVTVAAVAGLLALALGAASAQTLECANTRLVPNRTNTAGGQPRALVCLHNAARARHGLAPLRISRRLRRAAVGHARR